MNGERMWWESCCRSRGKSLQPGCDRAPLPWGYILTRIFPVGHHRSVAMSVTIGRPLLAAPTLTAAVTLCLAPGSAFCPRLVFVGRLSAFCSCVGTGRCSK